MLLVFLCVYICGYQKYMWYWPPTLKCPALGKRSRQRYCVQTLSSSSRLIADDSQDLPMNARVLCVYTCVTYLSVLITSSQKNNKTDVDFQINLSSVLLLLINSAFLCSDGMNAFNMWDTQSICAEIDINVLTQRKNVCRHDLYLELPRCPHACAGLEM